MIISLKFRLILKLLICSNYITRNYITKKLYHKNRVKHNFDLPQIYYTEPVAQTKDVKYNADNLTCTNPNFFNMTNDDADTDKYADYGNKILQFLTGTVSDLHYYFFTLFDVLIILINKF